MQSVDHVGLNAAHVLTLQLDVAFNAMLSIGATPKGRRRIAPILGGRFEGERLNGEVLPGGADWVINRPDGAMVIDVRIPLKTEDGALIYCTYEGVLRATAEVMQRFNRGEMLKPDEYKLRTLVRFEAGSENYQWLNDSLCVGIGLQSPDGPIYKVFEIL